MLSHNETSVPEATEKRIFSEELLARANEAIRNAEKAWSELINSNRTDRIEERTKCCVNAI